MSTIATHPNPVWQDFEHEGFFLLHVVGRRPIVRCETCRESLWLPDRSPRPLKLSCTPDGHKLEPK